jgi:hypothetical protein
MIIPGTITELFPGVEDAHAEQVLEHMRGLYEAHQHAYTHVGRTGENKFTGACSCGTWAVTEPVTGSAIRRSFDQHLAPVYAEFGQTYCFCLRLVFASPLAPGRWVHANYMHEFYAHEPVVLERAS